MRFGIVRNQALPWSELLAEWQLYDQLGFETGWATDHFQRPSDPMGPHLDSWTTLAAVAARTGTIRLGVLVSSNTFRHPALLAKQAITVDHISNGRLELGIGAGWFELEHASFGIDYPANPARVSQFAEALDVVDRLMREDISTYKGRWYSLTDAPSRPGPVQRPRPPITVGAHGPRMLELAARFADRWNSFGTIEEIRDRGATLERCCGQIGRILRRSFGLSTTGHVFWAPIRGAPPMHSWTSSVSIGKLVSTKSSSNRPAPTNDRLLRESLPTTSLIQLLDDFVDSQSRRTFTPSRAERWLRMLDPCPVIEGVEDGRGRRPLVNSCVRYPDIMRHRQRQVWKMFRRQMLDDRGRLMEFGLCVGL